MVFKGVIFAICQPPQNSFPSTSRAFLQLKLCTPDAVIEAMLLVDTAFLIKKMLPVGFLDKQ